MKTEDVVKIGVMVAIGYVVITYVLPAIRGVAEIGEQLRRPLDAVLSKVQDVKDSANRAKWFYKSGQPITLLDGAKGKLSALQNDLLDKRQGIFLFQARLYQIQPDGKSAKLAAQGKRVTLTLAGGKPETYVQGPLRVQVLVGK